MPEQIIHTHEFPNGLTVVIEPMSDVQSAAVCFLVPGGSVYDPPREGGTAAVLTEWIMRGAGALDSRSLSNAFDNLGVQRSESTGLNHIAFTAATLGSNVPAALSLYADVLRRPHLPDEEFEAAVAGIEQSLRAIEDEPQRKLMIELRRRCYDAPWGLPTEGCLDDLTRITAQSVRAHYERCLRPNGAILGVAGRVDVQQILDLVAAKFGDWAPKPEASMLTGPRGKRVDHILHDSTQTHIGIAYDAVEYAHPDYYKAWAAVGVLSGGMSARLFTEVRERRGLCYSVSASLNSLKHEGRVLCYAGTTAERAQETLDVTLRELQRLGDGIAAHELDRCKARAKSSLIMQQESTTSRATSIARDWHFLKRAQTLDEIRRDIDSLTVAGVLEYVHQHPARDFTVLTIGPNPLKVSSVQDAAFHAVEGVVDVGHDLRNRAGGRVAVFQQASGRTRGVAGSGRSPAVGEQHGEVRPPRRTHPTHGRLLVATSITTIGNAIRNAALRFGNELRPLSSPFGGRQMVDAAVDWPPAFICFADWH